MKSKYLHKSVTFQGNNEQDLELWKWLKSIGHGEFNKRTKEFWLSVMSKEHENDKV